MSTRMRDRSMAQGRWAHMGQRAQYHHLLATFPLCQIMMPLSGRAEAERVLPYVVVLATAGASISLVLVATTAAQAQHGAVAATEDLEHYLTELQIQLAMLVPRVETHVVRTADVARSLVAEECTEGTDLVVLSRGQTSDSAFPGTDSLALELLGRGHAPLLLIPPEAPPPTTRACILVALDGSPLAECALFPILTIANARQQQPIEEITLLAACEHEQEIGAATAYLDEVRTAVEQAVTCTVRVRTEVTQGRAAEAIVSRMQAPATKRYDVVALTTHGRGGFGGRLLGGVAEQILSHSRVPVLLVNARHP